ncbi:uncharacterized protein Aud_002783 [Aspergillus udagawae]|uniref:Lactose permease n=1 Tax=Aspergillus udagawae TaxID=91492 RepID=A0A8E0UUK2_9EURO|nr:uncharacterized protein Aud_002783 [Aspergillus udagawae]GIC86412.1 hypothetical protein Aud_002783 [Aspergillus udagawae]
MFVVARGILGFGTVFLGSSGHPLITEIAHPAHRATATAMFNTTYALGAIFAAWATFGTFPIDGSATWRVPSAIQGLPSLLQLLGLWMVPESSPLQLLAKYHAEGDSDDALVRFEYNEIEEALAYERSISKKNWIQSYLEFTRTSGNRKRLFILLWSACFAQIGITTGSAVFAQDSSNKAAGGAVVAFLYLFSPAYNFGINGNLGLYIAETHPVHLRMRDQACFQFFAKCFTLLATYAFPVGLENMGWKFYTIFIPWVAIEFIVVYFIYPETKGCSLEEIALILDGEPAEHSEDGVSRFHGKIVDAEHVEVTH